MALNICDHEEFLVVYKLIRGKTRFPVCQLIAEKEDIEKQLETAIDDLREANNG